MRVSAGGHGYEWVDAWAEIPDSPGQREAWAHNDLIVSRIGQVVAITPDSSRVLVYNTAGSLERSFDCGLVEGHGLAISESDGKEYLWIADCGIRMRPDFRAANGYEVWEPPQPMGRVLKVDLAEGKVVWQVPIPAHQLYADGSKYLPTAVALAPNGDIWVADGYGASLLHRFSKDGELLATITGEESAAGRLDQPHGILVDHRKDQPEIYVADRLNERIVVFDLDGKFLRELGKDLLARPSVLASSGDLLVVGGLDARVALVGLDDQVVGYLGDNQVVTGRPGWPNILVDDKLARPGLEPGKFNSPHGLAADSCGNIYVSEFVIGGRQVKLRPVV
jgi:hypothetical protein